MLFGSPILRTDLVNASLTLNTTYKRDTSFDSVPIVGELFELDYMQRNAFVSDILYPIH